MQYLSLLAVQQGRGDLCSVAARQACPHGRLAGPGECPQHRPRLLHSNHLSKEDKNGHDGDAHQDDDGEKSD
ncbi:hypothetical protein Nmel_018097 [Mimus melanotis]